MQMLCVCVCVCVCVDLEWILVKGEEKKAKNAM
jgi:hypothetical protein